MSRQNISISELKRIMEGCGLKLNMGWLATISKQLELDTENGNPAEVVRRFCSDIVHLKGGGRAMKEQRKEQKKEQKQGRKQQNSNEALALDDADQPDAIDAEGEDAAHGQAGSSLGTPEEFFEKVQGKFWSKERELRQALFRWIVRQEETQPPSEPMLIEEALQDEQIAKIVSKLLDRWGVPLQDWIERRIEEEVGVGLDSEERTVLFPLVPLQPLLMNPRTSRTQSEQGIINSADHAKLNEGKANAAEALKQLEGELTVAEELMSAKLFEFVSSWDGPIGCPLPVAAQSANMEKEMLLEELGFDAKAKAFPFRKWIEQRLSEKFELHPVGKNGQYDICIKGESRKRPAPAEGDDEGEAEGEEIEEVEEEKEEVEGEAEGGEGENGKVNNKGRHRNRKRRKA